MMNLLLMLNAHTDHLYAHMLGVSAYSVMIAKEMKWQSPSTLFKIAMGGLLHDIGKKEIPTDLLNKKRSEMTPQEIHLYETHPMRGMEILSQIQSIPSDVLYIALEHHENCLGLGYPRHLSKSFIHPMAKLVSVANEFCNMVLKGPQSMNIEPQEALHKMHDFLPGRFDPQFLAALMRVFKVPVPDEKSKKGSKIKIG